MAQRLKPELRSRILDAAREVFADGGYAGATMAKVASCAGISTGNVYRYFRNKDELFECVVPDSLRRRFLALVHDRVAALGRAPAIDAPDAPAESAAEALLAFFVAHRREAIILLAGADGSCHEGFDALFTDALYEQAAAQLTAGGARLSPPERLVLRTVFENTVRMLAAILAADDDEARIRAAFAAFWRYQLAGLAGFAEGVERCTTT